jgi:hypothetical protein
MKRLGLMCVAMLLASCEACDQDDFRPLAPTIDIGDPYADDRSICERDTASGDLRVSNCFYDFGEVGLNRVSALTFTIRNPSGVTLSIKSLQFEAGSDPAFELNGDAGLTSVAPNSSTAVTVVFSPELSSSATAVLLIDSDAENMPLLAGSTVAHESVRIELNGAGGQGCVGAPVITPSACACGQVGVNSAATCVVNIANEGNCDLLITDAAFSPSTDEDVFGVRGIFAAPTTVPAGSATSITLYCQPSSQDTFTGEFILEINDSETQSIPLSVEGANTPTAVADVDSVNGGAASYEVQPLDDVQLTGLASTPGSAGGSIVGYRWELIERAQGSSATLDSTTSPTPRFLLGNGRAGLDAAGTYIVALTVTDNLGAVSSNEANVVINVVPRQGLTVQLTWDTPSTDIDLHLNRGSTANGWCQAANDCYYANKTPNWGGGSADPSLDLDDTNGFGPENINIDSPNDGAYTVAVTFYSGVGNTNPLLKVFSGGQLLGEYQGQLGSAGDHWLPVRIEKTGGIISLVELDNYATQAGSCMDGGGF